MIAALRRVLGLSPRRAKEDVEREARIAAQREAAAATVATLRRVTADLEQLRRVEIIARR